MAPDIIERRKASA